VGSLLQGKQVPLVWHIPPRVLARFSGLPLTMGAKMLGQTEPLRQQLESLAETMDDGMWFVYLGHVEFSQGRFAEAREAYRRAARGPSNFKLARIESQGMLAIYGTRWRVDGAPLTSDEREEAVRCIEALLREDVQLADHLCCALTEAALTLKQIPLARRCYERWRLVARPNDEVFLIRTMELAWIDGEWYKAYLLAGRILELEPKIGQVAEAQKYAREIRLEARQKIDAIAASPAP
jgi:tetratricopeptide (TPR) repeat protein